MCTFIQTILEQPEKPKVTLSYHKLLLRTKAPFIRCLSAMSNAIKTIDNEMICFIM